MRIAEERGVRDHQGWDPDLLESPVIRPVDARDDPWRRASLARERNQGSKGRDRPAHEGARGGQTHESHEVARGGGDKPKGGG